MEDPAITESVPTLNISLNVMYRKLKFIVDVQILRDTFFAASRAREV